MANTSENLKFSFHFIFKDFMQSEQKPESLLRTLNVNCHIGLVTAIMDSTVQKIKCPKYRIEISRLRAVSVKMTQRFEFISSSIIQCVWWGVGGEGRGKEERKKGRKRGKSEHDILYQQKPGVKSL